MGRVQRFPGEVEHHADRELRCPDEDCRNHGSAWGHPGEGRLAATAALGNPWARFLAGETIPCRDCGKPLAEGVCEWTHRVPDRYVVTCDCGGRMEYWAHERIDYVECPKCGQPYNCSGQRLERNKALWDGTDGAGTPWTYE